MKLFVRIGFFIKIVFPLHEFRLRGIALKKKKKKLSTWKLCLPNMIQGFKF